MTQDEAIASARAVAESQGWAWVEPARASFRRPWFGGGGRWEIHSNAKGLAAIARVVLDDVTGRVLEKGYVPR